MKTLLKRLKPEVLQAMNADAEKYPHLIESIKSDLAKEQISPLNLTINTASYVCGYAKISLEVVNLINCFDKE